VFHFKGVFKGHEIDEIRLYSDVGFEIGDEYVMLIEVHKCSGKVLFGETVRVKNLADIRY
jgi:hypothetical protein